MTEQVISLVTGGAGFIGHHLAHYLREKGHFVVAVDIKDPAGYEVDADFFDWKCDMREFPNALRMFDGVNEAYCLAADMGGMGFISSHNYIIFRNNMLINLFSAEAARLNWRDYDEPGRLLFTSSACVYPIRRQMFTEARALKESDAWDGVPEDAYGREKLLSESLYAYMRDDISADHVETRTPRFHNIYGPEGAWDADTDNRVKAPAAMCYKMAKAKLTGDYDIPIWGDGKQRRSFCYIDDCLEMLYLLMHSDFGAPMNIGTDRSVSVDELAMIAAEAAGIADKVTLVHDISKPQGVRGRNADLSLMHRELGYEPQVSLEEGMARTYAWIYEQTKEKFA